MLQKTTCKLVILFCVISFSSIALSQTKTNASNYERWHIIRMMDQPAGWASTTVTTKDDKITTHTNTKITIRRGAIAVSVGMESRFIETTDGKPIELTTSEKMGVAIPTTRKLVFKENTIELTTSQGNRATTKTMPRFKQTWFTPEAARRYVAQKLKAGDKTITYWMLEPSTKLEPIQITMKVEGRLIVKVFGKSVPAIKARVTIAGMAGLETVEYIDDEARSVKSSINMGIISCTLEMADKQLAMQQINPPELLNKTLIKANRPIQNPRQVKRAVYRLTTTAKKLPNFPTTSVQQFKRISDQSADLTVDLNAKNNLNDKKPKIEQSQMIDGTDIEVIKLTKKATQNSGADPTKRAHAMRQFVYKYIGKKNLGVGMATASEVARTAQGDCTEHAVLLAAMLRADGIPSRTASGLIYVEQFLQSRNIFGYHMWTQAWLDGQWVDLDGVLDSIPFDATHIAISTSMLNDADGVNDMIKMVPLMGRLKIKVIQIK